MVAGLGREWENLLLLQKQFSVLLSFFSEARRIELVHLHDLDFVRVGQRRINALAVNKLAFAGHDFHALVAQEKINESLARLGMQGSVTESDVVSMTEHLVESHVIQRGAFLAEENHVFEIADADGCLSGADALSGIEHALHDERLGAGKAADRKS